MSNWYAGHYFEYQVPAWYYCSTRYSEYHLSALTVLVPGTRYYWYVLKWYSSRLVVGTVPVQLLNESQVKVGVKSYLLPP